MSVFVILFAQFLELEDLFLNLFHVLGVSALRQVLSCNLHRYSPSKLSVLNSSLPKEIRVHEAVPVAPSFDAWDWASHRHYSYLMPTYAFASLGTFLYISSLRVHLIRHILKDEI